MNETVRYGLMCAAAVLFATSMAASASANYLGYANGDPANWGFYEEQHNGASAPEPMLEAPVYSHVVRHPDHVRYHGRIYRRSGERIAPSED